MEDTTTTINDGGPAYPQHGFSSNPEVIERMRGKEGMTLRDYFAGQALAGLARLNYEHCGSNDIASMAYNLASEMLAARAGKEAA